MKPSDLLVVGGGPAGLATAIFAARAGMSVEVFERGSLPRDKACGEGLMPYGVGLLREMGVCLNPDDYRPFDGIRYVSGGHSASADFGGSKGWGIRRAALSEALERRAQELGVSVHAQTVVGRCDWSRGGEARLETATGTFRGRWLVAADGLHSRLRREAGLGRAPARAWPRSAARYGLRRHFQRRPWSRYVEVHWAAGLEAYVTPVSESEVGIALLFDKRATGSSSPMSFQQGLSRFPDIARELEGCAPTSPVMAGGPFRQRCRRRFDRRLALVGDAAGYSDAISGEGVALGFREARSLVEVLVEDQPLEQYEAAYREATRPYYQMTELLLLLAARPWLRRRAVAMLARNPELFERLLRIHHEGRPLRELGVSGAAMLVRGLMRAS